MLSNYYVQNDDDIDDECMHAKMKVASLTNTAPPCRFETLDMSRPLSSGCVAFLLHDLTIDQFPLSPNFWHPSWNPLHLLYLSAGETLRPSCPRRALESPPLALSHLLFANC